MDKAQQAWLNVSRLVESSQNLSTYKSMASNMRRRVEREEEQEKCRPRTRHKLGIKLKSSNNKCLLSRRMTDLNASNKCFTQSFVTITLIMVLVSLFSSLKYEVNATSPSTINVTKALEKRTALNPSPRRMMSDSSAAAAASVSHITEADLLPFSDFIVKQPSFSDIMKTWPPTTLDNLQKQRQGQASNPRAAARHRHRQSSRAGSSSLNDLNNVHSQTLDEVHNHLNEDLDDTVVTADESFEQDQLQEPPTWVNYLGELGDFIYSQLRHFYESSSRSPFASSQDSQQAPDSAASSSSNNNNNNNNNENRLIETIDELLDDFYYDQYENSQVLYYGAQLAREGDIVEIGCYLPRDQPAEWTKSGRPLMIDQKQIGGNSISSLRIIRRGDFLAAKQNFSLKIFEANLSDSGNYRCNRMSRKYHKLLVVPSRLPVQQLYAIQQRLLHVINPQAAASSSSGLGQSGSAMDSYYSASAIGGQVQVSPARSSTSAGLRSINVNSDQMQQQQLLKKNKQTPQILLPGHIIRENQPLIVQCQISDEFVLRRLRELPQFQLAWYKNGRLLRASQLAPSQTSSSSSNQTGRPSHQQPPSPSSMQRSNQRLQFLGPNGRQLYISAAIYSDAGDYLCSWSRLPVARQMQASEEDEQHHNNQQQQQQQHAGKTIATNPLAAGSLHQLLAPVKLRPFKSAYHVQAGQQLRLICQVQRGYPQAQITWYIGNRPVDVEFLREHPEEFRLLQFSGSSGSSNSSSNSVVLTSTQGSSTEVDRLVEINPIPSQRQQMQLTANGRGSWMEFRHLKSDPVAQEKFSIDSAEQRLKYMKMKLAQLTGQSASTVITSDQQQQILSGYDQTGTGVGSSAAAMHAVISVLVINKLDTDKHNSRYSCRATTRANTDEVTTMVRVRESKTHVVKPTGGAATLIPGQPLHFECRQSADTTNGRPVFLWYKVDLGQEESSKRRLEPNEDDTIEIHNERLTLTKPNYSSLGDYICSAHQEGENEFAVIKVRAPPYIEDFGIETSHTGKSATLFDGQRLELVCHVPDESAPVNITWLRSDTSDDSRSMVEVESRMTSNNKYIGMGQNHHTPLALPDPASSAAEPSEIKTYSVPGLIVEKINNYTKKLIIDQVGPQDRGFYTCVADNGVTERSTKTIFIRVKDNIIALWPFLGILAELFILFTIIHVWETQKAYKETQSAISSSSSPQKSSTSPPPPPTTTMTPNKSKPGTSTNKREPSGPTNAFETVPLNTN